MERQSNPSSTAPGGMRPSVRRSRFRLTALVGGDSRVREAHRMAVTTALGELERYTQARIGGNHPAESTGQFIVAKFEHDTSRPVDGYAAPQLHTHAVIFNVTERARRNDTGAPAAEPLRVAAVRHCRLPVGVDLPVARTWATRSRPAEAARRRSKDIRRSILTLRASARIRSSHTCSRMVSPATRRRRSPPMPRATRSRFSRPPKCSRRTASWPPSSAISRIRLWPRPVSASKRNRTSALLRKRRRPRRKQ